MPIEPTTLKYMDDSYLFESNGNILSIEQRDDGKYSILFDQTIFYPQGGGQPYDQGFIIAETGKFKVEEVRFDKGYVYHIGQFEQGSFNPGINASQQIDKERRILNSKLQSGGHLIDMALIISGYVDLKPSKGFHFPEGPNVEYIGSITEDKRAEMIKKVQDNLDKMIDLGYQVQSRYADKDQLEELCYITPSQLPEDKPIRIVSVWDQKFMPCGATHVKNIRELKGLKISKIKCKGDNTKISYLIEG